MRKEEEPVPWKTPAGPCSVSTGHLGGRVREYRGVVTRGLKWSQQSEKLQRVDQHKYD